VVAVQLTIVRVAADRLRELTMVQFVPMEEMVETGHSTAKLTYADYVRFPNDGLRHEIIDGEHYVTPSPATRHQRIVRNLLHLIQSYLDAHPIGEIFCAPFDALLSEFDIVVPDLLYLSNERAGFLTSKNLQGPPDLVIEILSPSTKYRDLRLKRDLYERVGVREYWIVDPDREVVKIYRHRDGSFEPAISLARPGVVTTSLFPNFELPLDRVLN
jgi:Uma2 family endonuclease